jgi:hypothetical protein
MQQSGPTQAPRTASSHTSASAPAPKQRKPSRARPAHADPVPDEAIALMIVGAKGSGRDGVLGALLDAPGPLLDRPGDSYLVVTYGHSRDVCAYVPGNRQPQPFTPTPPGEEYGARPPRRIELTLPNPLLRHFALVDTPDAEGLSAAGTRILLDAAIRGGAVLYVVSAGHLLEPAEATLLAELHRAGVHLFFALTPATDGAWGDGTVETAISDARDAVIAAVPSAADASWHTVDPAMGDTAFLRRALSEWSGLEALERASINPPVPPGAGRTVRIASDADRSGWAERLEDMTRTSAQLIRQRLAIEVANIHLRCVQVIVFGEGCAGLPGALDREMHALSLAAVAECDTAAEKIIDDLLELVLDEPATEAARRRVIAAVRDGFAEDRAARDLERVLLVTNTGGVATVAGEGAVTALTAYHTPGIPRPLPGLGIGLSGACYTYWRHPANRDNNRARSWLQLAIRGVELELLREISRRFEAVQRSLGGVLTDAVDHGILLS